MYCLFFGVIGGASPSKQSTGSPAPPLARRLSCPPPPFDPCPLCTHCHCAWGPSPPFGRSGIPCASVPHSRSAAFDRSPVGSRRRDPPPPGCGAVGHRRGNGRTTGAQSRMPVSRIFGSTRTEGRAHRCPRETLSDGKSITPIFKDRCSTTTRYSFHPCAASLMPGSSHLSPQFPSNLLNPLKYFWRARN